MDADALGLELDVRSVVRLNATLEQELSYLGARPRGIGRLLLPLKDEPAVRLVLEVRIHLTTTRIPAARASRTMVDESSGAGQ